MAFCSVDGCGVNARTLGLCNKHALRFKRLGHVGDTQKAQAPIDVRLRRRFVVGLPMECWPWLGMKSKLGYGMISVGSKEQGQRLAHRVSWEVHNGRSIPEGMAVLHECDNPSCVNPSHLRVGTQSENSADMRQKNRGASPPRTQFGSKHHDTKLTEEDVRYIRSCSETSYELAARFGMNYNSINKIRARTTWKHVT